ncbi:MAG: hypothetical protein A2418_01625 [Candidatus Brennerbacteria bacterium RIFOXYC1_FULL_41_11]|uniref:Uncharacterized protein n=1 Tax=Candidatus Brennerbacteria bacterium RIFOXYD1_FULL_41_16 TaxID=1797529 RepID=A0A1G1XJ26_9BACT|nr:MAG: hypothetical protein A2418_01625 [Candidatus Brennerbacteria bacterium RIFOXYC1_FULL_41_11]OGY39381.1 MAG: hypothetical protein A2391_02815 [Candidatus Brennerbacteria bacterium RIFOXYB1_FULL_41_13]OGY40008.1 MAG: hypothetical protein A2570_00765 [Candidatus Brennerbacteria bacterium RIFOXYD1_FULL_41_16]
MSTSARSQRLPITGLSSPKNFVFGSLAFLLAAASLYLFLSGYLKLVESRIKSSDREIQDIVASISLEEVEKVITLDAQIRGLKKLLPNHFYLSSVFDFLENNTNPKISFKSLKVSTLNNQIILSGTAKDLQDISIQAAAFKQHPDIKDVILKDVSNIGLAYNFQLELLFSKSLILIK